MLIGIIGYGMVGRAVEYGFRDNRFIVCDPKYNQINIKNVCLSNPNVIFVCVPTPTDDTNYANLKDVLDEIVRWRYKGLVVVKSTILPHHLRGYDVVYNPEFLTRATAFQDFVTPPILVIGGKRAPDLLEFYQKYSKVEIKEYLLTDIKTAAMIKYTMNSFYATKVTFMNQMYEVAIQMGANYDDLIHALEQHPWMGSHHFQVPGPDGKRGFGGPCLPKDTEAFAKEYKVDLLNKVLEINKRYRPS